MYLFIEEIQKFVNKSISSKTKAKFEKHFWGRNYEDLKWDNTTNKKLF